MTLQRDERGAIAMIFGAALFPIVGVLGLGVDAAMYLDAKERLDAWTEAACERVNAPAVLPTGDRARWRAAETLFEANARQLPSAGEEISLTQSPIAGGRRLSASYVMNPLFGGLFGVSSYEANSNFDCKLEIYVEPTPPSMIFVFIDRGGRRAYRVPAELGMTIYGRGGDALFPQWLDIKVIRSRDRQVLVYRRASNYATTTFPPSAENVVIEVRARARSTYNNQEFTTTSRACGGARLCIEDENDNDFNDAIYDFRAQNGQSAFNERYYGDPFNPS